MLVPAAAVGVIAAAISAATAGSKGGVGSALGMLVVLLFMGLGQLALQYVSKAMPQLFQGMALMIYSVQLVLLLGFVMAVRDTTSFDLRTFAFTLVAATVVWIAAQARAHVKSRTLYVEPATGEQRQAQGVGASDEK
jgi:ATP synthase protein I